MKILIYLLFCSCIFLNFQQPEGWELRRNERGIAVYSRKLTDASFKQIKVECELPGTPAQLIAVLKKVDSHPDWVYATSKSTFLKKINDSRYIYHTETDMPWPVTDRDLIAETIISPETKSGQLHIEVKSLPEYLPVKKDFIRVPYSMAVWDIMPLTNHKMKIVYTFSINPGGSVPPWLVNATVTTGPFNTFVKLREILNKNLNK